MARGSFSIPLLLLLASQLVFARDLESSSSSSARSLAQSAPTDVDILNFALNLEYLEAEFYSWAAWGYGLNETDRGFGPPSTGGKKAKLSVAAQAYAVEIATHEVNHVRFLRAALGNLAVPAPLIDIGPAFAKGADLALNTTLNPPFTPYGSDILFYHGAFLFEDVGVTAYHGAASAISSKAYLDAAAGILAVEAYHAGILRLLLAQVADQYVFPYGAQVATIVGALSALRDAAAGTQADQNIVKAINGPGNSTYYASNLVPVDKNSIAFSRTPQQVLKIVYGGGINNGLFFPNGVNGNIKSAA